jgi:hypothetical protein
MPLCFVLMPFGTKTDAGIGAVDFDAVYDRLIKPAIIGAGMEPLRADADPVCGIIHLPMIERLMLCDYAVADLTTANANVYYELGIRHALRPASTVLLFAKGSALRFDVAPLRALPYHLSLGKPTPAKLAGDQAALTERLKACRDPRPDSPVYQLIRDLPPPDITRLKTDTFRERSDYHNRKKEDLASARHSGTATAVQAVEAGLGSLADVETGVLIDLFLSYRAVSAWQAMVDLVPRLPRELQRVVLVQEQLGFALNRLGRGEEAIPVLEELIAERGPSSETCGILGRVYKDRWDQAAKAGDPLRAAGYLRKAIDTYLKGFEADWRDAYPGINAVTLMELATPVDTRQAGLLPVVRYAVERRISGKAPDYWDHATRLELAVLAGDSTTATVALADALAARRERWEPETTARNLRLIREARAARGEDVGGILDWELALLAAAAG